MADAAARDATLRRTGSALAFAASKSAVFVATSALTLVTARALGPASFGTYATGSAIAALTMMFQGFGLESRYLDGSIDARTLRRRLWQAAVISAALVGVVALAWPGIAAATRAATVLSGIGLAAILARTSWALEAQRALRTTAVVARDLATRLPPFLALAVVAAAGGSAVKATAAFAIVAVLTSFAPATLGAPGLGAPQGFGHEVRQGLAYAALTGLFVVYFSVDQAVLGTLGTSTDAGLYRAAYGFLTAAIVLPTAINSEFMRTRLFQAVDAEGFAAVARSGAQLTAVAAVAVTCTVEALGGRLAVHLVYGAAFTEAAALLRILGLAVVPHYVASWSGNVLVARRHVRWVTTSQATLVVVNLVGNLALVPRFGARGSAWMTVATEALGGALFLGALLVKRRAVGLSGPRR